MKKTLLVLAGFFLISCSEKKVKADKEPIAIKVENYFETAFHNDSLYSKINCLQDNSNSYALYLPDDYDTIKKHPVLFFIDAHADGSLPISKYKTLADKFGYIFVGNNNSKNGNSLDANAQFINQMISDAVLRFSIDKNRISVCGFSGGSRVAGHIGQNNPLVNGVIACSAGMQMTSNLKTKQFIYIGIAGKEDFNYTEMKNTETALNRTVVKHSFLSFDGKHEWCPLEVMEEAVIGIEFEAMKLKTAALNPKLIDQFVLNATAKITQLQKQNKMYELADQLKIVINYLDGLQDVTDYKKKYAEIESSVGYIKEAQERSAAEEKEEALKNQYVQMLADKDENWWSNEIKSINSKIKSGKNKEDVLIEKRILSYLSLASFSYANNAMNQDNMEAAIHFLNLYKIIDPPNSEHSYMLAEVYAIKNDPEKSIASLNDAIKLGFKDVARLENDPHFVSLKNSPQFIEVINKLKSVNTN